jgi:hypothetical protein
VKLLTGFTGIVSSAEPATRVSGDEPVSIETMS